MGKIIKSIITNTFEAVKDSAKQVADTVSPGSLLEQALGKQKSQSSEFTEYLKNVGGELSPEELEKKKKEFSQSDQEKLEETRKKLLPSVPAHMKPPPTAKGPRPYEATIQEEERKKAQAVEMQKKQASQQITPPSGKKARGSLFSKKKKATPTGFEVMKGDKKAG
ncbi:hypothetical protein HYW55_01440 [Candidatus Gottesmanbacteria bacterium]|nr:hypothetical protein [Candidatus Gottesmanbacteria bacterium]